MTACTPITKSKFKPRWVW